MGLYDRDYYQNETTQGTGFSVPQSIVIRLVIINVAVFLIGLLFFDRDKPLNSFLWASQETLTKPWQIYQLITAGFAHDDRSPMHILFNMIALYFFGRALEQQFGAKKFLSFYLTAIIFGNLVFVLVSLIFSLGAPVIGASGGVVATILVFAMLYPNQTVLVWGIPVKAWVLGAFIIVQDVIGAAFYRHVAGEASRTAYNVHLAGAAYGYLFFKTRWDLSNLFSGSFKRFKMPKKRPKMRLYDPDSRSRQIDQQADAILEKLHQQGEASLTAKERKILEEYSRKMRQKHQ